MKSSFEQLWRHEKIRFGAVGILNTVVDFAILFSLVIGLSVPTAVANIAATTAALLVSYTLNKKAVFRAGGGRRSFFLFIGITLVGLWVVQTAVIVAVESLIHSVVADTSHGPWVLFAAKLVGTAVSLTWNYIWYSNVVFKGDQPKK